MNELDNVVTMIEAVIAISPDKQWILQGEPSNESEFASMVYCVVGADEDGSAILSNDPADVGMSWTTLKAKYDELVSSRPLLLLRRERDRLLAETDWWVLPDRIPTEEQLAYRQELRDITETYSSLDDVVFPTKPV